MRAGIADFSSVCLTTAIRVLNGNRRATPAATAITTSMVVGILRVSSDRMSNQWNTGSAMNDAQKAARVQHVATPGWRIGAAAFARLQTAGPDRRVGNGGIGCCGMLLAAWLTTIWMSSELWWLCIPLVAILQSLIHKAGARSSDPPDACSGTSHWACNLMLCCCAGCFARAPSIPGCCKRLPFPPPQTFRGSHS